MVTPKKFLSCRVTAILILLMSLSSHAASPTVAVGGRQVDLPDDTPEEHREMIEAIGIYDDPELAAYIDTLSAKQLVANSSMPDTPVFLHRVGFPGHQRLRTTRRLHLY